MAPWKKTLHHSSAQGCLDKATVFTAAYTNELNPNQITTPALYNISPLYAVRTALNLTRHLKEPLVFSINKEAVYQTWFGTFIGTCLCVLFFLVKVFSVVTHQCWFWAPDKLCNFQDVCTVSSLYNNLALKASSTRLAQQLTSSVRICFDNAANALR